MYFQVFPSTSLLIIKFSGKAARQNSVFTPTLCGARSHTEASEDTAFSARWHKGLKQTVSCPKFNNMAAYMLYFIGQQSNFSLSSSLNIPLFHLGLEINP